MRNEAVVLGAGLAGCEAAWQLAEAGIPVSLVEMKPLRYSPAHKYPGFAELVCSNSLKASRVASAAGLLKEEMRRLGSLTVSCAEQCAVSAGGALAVDRTRFSDLVTEKIRSHPLIHVEAREAEELPAPPAVVATGPLTAGKLAEAIQELCGNSLSFYDAAAPIVTFDSLDQEKVFLASRYGRGEADYINCAMNKEEYQAFRAALLEAESAPLHEFDRPDPGKKGDPFAVYEGCMPIEVLASRGEDAMRFGPMKPVGLTDPRTGKRPYAVVQLRTENGGGTLYNLVGFQTNLKFGEQKRVFSMIPGLENAEFVRYGVMHRNSFLDSPRLLGKDYALRDRPGLYFAGQITGVEGYMESAASGILAGKNLSRALLGKPALLLPPETMLGALTAYICDPEVKKFQPMGANMGVLPALKTPVRGKQARYEALASRSLERLAEALEGAE